MLPKQKSLSYINRKGFKFTFEKVGDILPMHSHGEKDVHITVIAKGSFKIRGKGWEVIYKAGDVLGFKPGQLHEYEALEDYSIIVNILDD